MLSGLTASATNEFCEVALGGLITLPAAVAFLGVAGVAGQGTFGLGFHVLPMVFSSMPAGSFFGAVLFFVLFIAALTSSLSMLQPGIALLEESLGIGRKGSVGLLGTMTALGTGFVSWFTKDLKALDTLDFWVGTVLIFTLALKQANAKRAALPFRHNERAHNLSARRRIGRLDGSDCRKSHVDLSCTSCGQG